MTLTVQLLYTIHTSTGTPWPVNTARCQPMRSMDYPHFRHNADVNRIHTWETSGNDGWHRNLPFLWKERTNACPRVCTPYGQMWNPFGGVGWLQFALQAKQKLKETENTDLPSPDSLRVAQDGMRCYLDVWLAVTCKRYLLTLWSCWGKVTSGVLGTSWSGVCNLKLVVDIHICRFDGLERMWW